MASDADTADGSCRSAPASTFTVSLALPLISSSPCCTVDIVPVSIYEPWFLHDMMEADPTKYSCSTELASIQCDEIGIRMVVNAEMTAYESPHGEYRECLESPKNTYIQHRGQ